MLRGAVLVRDAVPEDAPALLEAWAESLGDRVDQAEAPTDVPAAVARILAEPSERLVVAETEGEVAGHAYLRRAPITPLHDDDAVHIGHLHVRRHFRRRGVGKALFLHMQEDVIDQGVGRLKDLIGSWLGVYLHRSLGHTLWGLEKNGHLVVDHPLVPEYDLPGLPTNVTRQVKDATAALDQAEAERIFAEAGKGATAPRCP